VKHETRPRGTRTQPHSVAKLAAALGLEWSGDGEFIIEDVAPLDAARPGDLAQVRSASYQARISESRAGALLLPRELDAGDRPVLYSNDPRLDFARAVELLRPRRVPEGGRHPSAWIDESARVADSAALGPGTSVGAHTRVGARTILHANVSLYPDVVIGEDCELHAGVVLREGTVLGDRVVLQPGVVLGGDGFGYVLDRDGDFRRVPQVGCVVLEDDVEIGANTTVDRATLGETRIRRGAKIDNLVQIAHNCDVGENVVVAAQSGLSGSTEVGRRAIIMAQAGSAGHLEIGAGAFVGARAWLHKDVADGGRVFGSPQMEERRWHRAIAALSRLPDMLRRVRALERKLGIGRSSAKSSNDESS